MYTVGLLCLCLLLNMGCTADSTPSEPPADVTTVPTLGSCTLPNSYPTDEEAIQAVIEAEAQFVVAQEIVGLMQLWKEGASVIDAKNTPHDSTDDQRWLDKDAIRHRYVRTVFPGAPTTISPKDLIITINGTQAVITATTQIDQEVSPAGDRWVLAKQGDCWGIESLTYNLEKQQ